MAVPDWLKYLPMTSWTAFLGDSTPEQPAESLPPSAALPPPQMRGLRDAPLSDILREALMFYGPPAAESAQQFGRAITERRGAQAQARERRSIDAGMEALANLGMRESREPFAPEDRPAPPGGVAGPPAGIPAGLRDLVSEIAPGINRQVTRSGDSALTRYETPQGYAEFQGTPTPGGSFSGAATDAEAMRNIMERYGITDPSQLERDAYGNIRDPGLQIAERTLAERQQKDIDDEIMGTLMGLMDADPSLAAGLFQLLGNQRVAEGDLRGQQRQQAFERQQQGIENQLAAREQATSEMLADMNVSKERREAMQASPFSSKTLQAVLKDSMNGIDGVRQWVELHGGLLAPNPARNGQITLFTPDEVEQMTPEEITDLTAGWER